MPNSIRASIPSFSTARKRYELKIRKNGKLAPLQAPESDDLFLRSCGSAPPSEAIHVQHIGWGETFVQVDDDNDGVFTWFHYPPPYLNAGNDAWTGDWAPVKSELHDPAGRDWATICGAAWNPGAPMILSGLAEEVPRESLTWNFYARLEVGGGSPFLDALDSGTMLWDPQDTSAFTGSLAGVTGPPCSTELDPTACASLVGKRQNAIVVHHVVKMVLSGVEVDPLDDFRGRTPPGFDGMIILSNNPCFMYRPDPPIGVEGASFPADMGTPGWADDPLRPPTPGLLGHELVHALLGLLDETRDFVVQVSDPSGPSERGYRVDSQLPNPQATHAENCAVGFAGLGSTDFTR